MAKMTLKSAQAKLDKISSQKHKLLVESANRKIESAKLTLEAAKLADQFNELNLGSVVRCW